MFNYPGSPDPRVWATKKDLDKAFGSIRAVEAKVDFLAKSAMTLTVKLGSNGGEGTTPDVTVAGFAKGTLPACSATKAGHECGSWNTKADGTGGSYPVGSKIDWTAFEGTTLRLYAVWTPCTYQVEYELDGGVNGEGNPSSYVYGVGVPALAPASKDGKEFVGWYSDAEFGTEVTGISETDVGDKRLYAKFADPS